MSYLCPQLRAEFENNDRMDLDSLPEKLSTVKNEPPY